ISGATGGARIFFDVLDQVSDVDSRSQRAGRKFLGEDRIPRAGYETWEYNARGCEGRQGKNGADRAAPCAIFPHLARWSLEDSRGNERDAARYRFQWVWRHKRGGSFR